MATMLKLVNTHTALTKQVKVCPELGTAMPLFVDNYFFPRYLYSNYINAKKGGKIFWLQWSGRDDFLFHQALFLMFD